MCTMCFECQVRVNEQLRDLRFRYQPAYEQTAVMQHRSAENLGCELVAHDFGRVSGHVGKRICDDRWPGSPGVSATDLREGLVTQPNEQHLAIGIMLMSVGGAEDLDGVEVSTLRSQ